MRNGGAGHRQLLTLLRLWEGLLSSRPEPSLKPRPEELLVEGVLEDSAPHFVPDTSEEHQVHLLQ